MLPFYIQFEAKLLLFTDSKNYRKNSDFLSKHLYWLKKSAWKRFCLMRRNPEHICYSLLQIIFKAESPVLPNSPEPCDWQVNVKPWAPGNLAKRLRTPTLTNRPHAQIHEIRVLNPAAKIEVNQSFHSVSAEIFVLSTDSGARKITRKPKLTSTRNNV